MNAETVQSRSDGPAGRLHLPWWTWWLPLPVFFAATWLSLPFRIGPGISLWYLLTAFALVLVQWWGPRVLPMLYLNAVLCAHWWDLPWQWAPVHALTETLPAFLSWWLFARLGRGDASLPERRSTVRFLTLGLLVPVTAGSLHMMVHIVALGQVRPPDFWFMASAGWLADCLACLAISVPILLFGTDAMRRRGWALGPVGRRSSSALGEELRSHRRQMVAAGLFLAASALSVVAPMERFWFVYGLLLLVAALVFGVGLTVLLTSWVTVLTLLLPVVASGRFGGAWTQETNTLEAHVNMVVLCLAGLLTARTVTDLRQEIRQRRRDAVALRDSEERFRELAENVQEVLWVGSVDWQEVQYISPAYERIWGRPRSELHDHPLAWLDAAVPEDRSRIRAIITGRNPTDRSPIHFPEYRIVRPDGSIRWIASRSIPVLDEQGTPYRIAGIAEDITDRRQAEEALRASEFRYRALFDNMRNGVAVYRVEDGGARFIVADMNDAGQRHSRVRKHDVVGRNVVDAFPGIKEMGLLDVFTTVARSGHPEFFPASQYQGGGFARWYENYVYRLPTGELVAVYDDVTDRKKAELEIRQLNEELERRVSDRTAQLEATNQELDAFSYSVSHDLRAPLRAMNGYSQALLEDYAHLLDDQARHCLMRISKAANHMAELIDDLLNLSRLTRAEIHRESVDLSRMASAVITDLRRQGPDRQVEIAIAPDIVAYGDPVLLRAVLENLLANAWKFTSPRERAEIMFGVEKDQGRRTYFVRDNGAGFDMAYVNKLFGAFQRLHAQDEFPGTGIGLATVQRIVHRHGGRVWAEGHVGQGATIRFTLDERVPAASGSAPAVV